jgi:hypothetical protein
MRSLGNGMTLIMIAVLTACVTSYAHPTADPEAVKAAMTGECKVANAAWWGFDPVDATAILQAAIDSGVPTLIVPNMGHDWVVRPLRLRSNQEIVLEEGVVISAKKGEFRGSNDSLLTARDAENLIIRGYGATIRMHKEDYAAAPYTKAEWRMGINLRGCRNVQILGLTIENTGGDGIYLGRGARPVNEAIVIRDVLADNNYRQGISVISARDLLIENSVFRNTSGTAPMAGIDFEPNQPDEALESIVIRRCVFEGNEGSGITFYMKNMSPHARVSVLIENTLVRSNHTGIAISAGDPGEHPAGEIILRRCIVEDSKRSGLRLSNKDGYRLQLLVEDCLIHNVSTDPAFVRNNVAASAPIYLHATNQMGAISFQNVIVSDEKDRPALYGTARLPADGEIPLDIVGELQVISPFRAGPHWDCPMPEVPLTVVQKDSARVDYGPVSLRPEYALSAREVCIRPAIQFEQLSWLDSSTVQGTLFPGLRILHLDESQVRSVEVLLDGEAIYSGPTLPTPDALKIDTLALPDDQHELTAVVTTEDSILKQSTRFATHNFRYLTDPFEGPKEVAWFGTVYTPRTSEQSTGWSYATKRPEDFFGDAHRKVRQDNTTEHLIWETPKLVEFILEVYAREKQLDPAVLILEGSSGDESWYVLTHSVAHTETSPAGWRKFVINGELPHDDPIQLLRLTLRQSDVYQEVQLGQAIYRLVKE